MGIMQEHHKKWFTETKLQRWLNRWQKSLKRNLKREGLLPLTIEKKRITKQVKKGLLKIDVLDGFGFVKITNKAIYGCSTAPVGINGGKIDGRIIFHKFN